MRGVRIGQISIRVPGVNRPQARVLAQSVAERLASSATEMRGGVNVGAVHIRIPAAGIQSGAGKLADTIAARILEALR